MTLWIGAAALATMIVMFTLGISRGQSADTLFVTAIALAIAAIPTALPTVLQVILSGGAKELAGENAIVKDLMSVETLGSTSAINSDKTGTLTMNQMTAVELVDAGRPLHDLRDRLRPRGQGPPRRRDLRLDRRRRHPVHHRQRRQARRRQGRRRPDRGRPARPGPQGRARHRGEPGAGFPRLATLPFDPTYKLMATFNSATDSSGNNVVRCFVKGAAPAVIGRAATALAAGASVPWDETLEKKADDVVARMEGEGQRVMAAASRDLDAATFDADGDLLGYVTDLEMASIVAMVDPPREASMKAVHDAQRAGIRVRMVTGDDVITGAAIAAQLGIPGSAMLGSEFAALSDEERLARIDDIGVVGTRRARAQGAARRRPSRRRATSSPWPVTA